MTKSFEKKGFRLSFPMVLLLIATLLYGVLLIVTRLPQNEPKLPSIKCVGIKFEDIAGIKIGCNPPLYQIVLLAILGLIVCGPFLIVLRIFSVVTVNKEWIIIYVIFSFLIYFLIDYLIKIISRVITQKHFEKK